MANIIEKEIERRNKLIGSIDEKKNKIAELKREIDTLTIEVQSFNRQEVEKEITELNQYLPHPTEENKEQNQ